MTENKVNWREIGKRAAGTALGAATGHTLLGPVGAALGGYAGYKIAKDSKTPKDFFEGVAYTAGPAFLGGAAGAALGTAAGAAGAAGLIKATTTGAVSAGQLYGAVAAGKAAGIAGALAGSIGGGKLGYGAWKNRQKLDEMESLRQEGRRERQGDKRLRDMTDEELVSELNRLDDEIDEMIEKRPHLADERTRSRRARIRERRLILRKELAARQAEKREDGGSDNCGTGAGGFKKGNTCGAKVTNAFPPPPEEEPLQAGGEGDAPPAAPEKKKWTKPKGWDSRKKFGMKSNPVRAFNEASDGWEFLS